MTINDLRMSECYTRAYEQLKMANEMERAGDKVGLRLAWKALLSQAEQAVKRCDELPIG